MKEKKNKYGYEYPRYISIADFQMEDTLEGDDFGANVWYDHAFDSDYTEYVRQDIVPRWHDVLEELPQDYVDVVVYNGFEYAIANVGRMPNGEVHWYTPADGFHTEDITMWCDIPKRTKEEE